MSETIRPGEENDIVKPDESKRVNDPDKAEAMAHASNEARSHAAASRAYRDRELLGKNFRNNSEHNNKIMDTESVERLSDHFAEAKEKVAGHEYDKKNVAKDADENLLDEKREE